MNLSLPGISIIVPTFRRVDQTRKSLSLLYLSRGWNSQFFPEVILADSTKDESVKTLASEFNNPTPMYVAPSVPSIATNKKIGAKTESDLDSHRRIKQSDFALNPEKQNCRGNIKKSKFGIFN